MQIPAAVRARALEKLFPPTDPYVHDPAGWVKNRCKKWLWSKQIEIMESVRDNRFTAVPSCHGPGKSFTASCTAAWWMDVHPPGQAFFLSTAPTDSQVKAILWREIRRRHREAGMNGRITLEAHWYATEMESLENLVGLGRKPQDYDPDAFQGIHAKYVLIIIDEACGVPKQLWDALETLMTNDYARILAIGNPDDPTSHFETICRPGSGWNVIRIPAFITPNFTGEPVPSTVAEDLVTKQWVQERADKWGKSSPLYISKVLAEFPEISSDTLITPAMIRAAQDRNLQGLALGNYGADVARYGPDETVVYRNRGGKVRLVYSAHQQATTKTTDAFHKILVQHGISWVPMYVDVVGIGGAVVDEMRARGLNVIDIHVGQKADDTQQFANKRAELYWTLRKLFEEGLVDIDPNDEGLASQLGTLKWFITRRGQIAIESKEDARRRGIPSPDRADGMMLACAPPSFNEGAPAIIVGSTVTGDLLHKVM